MTLVLELLDLDDLGKPSMPFTNGYSIGLPMRRAKAMNCAGSSAWSRKKTTWCSRNAWRISATVFAPSSWFS
jgi:hypothetical protein